MANRAVSQHRIEQRRGLRIALTHVRIETNFLGQLPVRDRPFGRRWREPIRKTMLTPSLEDSHERSAKARGIQHHELLHEDKIDEIF